MKKILIIDYISPLGHKNFDKIHVESLLKNEYHIVLLGKKHQFDKIQTDNNLVVKNLPSWCCCKIKYLSPLLCRLQGIFTLFYIMFRYTSNEYEYTIFLYYDILSLFFFRSPSKVVLINHNNVGQLNSKIKLQLTKWYNEEMHICLSRYMQDRLLELLSNHRVEYVPHGLITPFRLMIRPNFIPNKSCYLFCPVNSNFNHRKISEILNSKILHDFLEKNDIALYTKPINGLCCKSRVIHIIHDRLPDSEYNYLLKNAIAILLPYTEEFQYRCSGIFFESVANEVPVISYSNPSISAFAETTDMYEFCDDSSLVTCIQECVSNGRRFINKDIFSPYKYWSNIL